MPSKTKMKNAAIAAKTAALPSIPKELIDQFVTGPMTGEAVNAGHGGVQEGADRARPGCGAVAPPGLRAGLGQARRCGQPPQRQEQRFCRDSAAEANETRPPTWRSKGQ